MNQKPMSLNLHVEAYPARPESDDWVEVRDSHGRLLCKVEPELRQIHIRKNGRDYVVPLAAFLTQ